VTGPPLAGRTVVVTRTRAQASVLVDRLEDLGATVVELPVIAIEAPSDDGAALSAAAHRLAAGAYQWVAFTSSNAVVRFLAVLGDRTVPESVRWAAVGPGTARTLTESGRPPELVPAASVSEALAEAFPDLSGPPPSGRRPEWSGTVLFPRAERVRGALADGLRAKGWLVDEVIAYRTVADDPDPDSLAAAARADAIAFTSSSTVERSVDLLTLQRIPPVVVSIGPVTSGSARAAGLEVAAEARPPSIDGLVGALVEVLVGEGGDPGVHTTGLP
jgi:uroporphyrinogen-III synthase